MNLLGFVALASLWLQASGAALPPETSVDLDGDGTQETARVLIDGSKVRLEVRDSRGKRADAHIVPSPRSRNPVVGITTGSLGSAGALLAVVAAGQTEECRSLWRFRAGQLDRLPVRDESAPLPDCEPAAEWSYRWDQTSEDKPAAYVRERTRSTERGPVRQVEAFAFTGFALELDPARSLSEVRGIPVPNWNDSILYQPQALQALRGRFDFAPLRSLPRLSIVTDRTRGVFSLRFVDQEGEMELPITGSAETEAKGAVRLTARGGERQASAEIELVNGDLPVVARVSGLGPRFDSTYAPVARLRKGGLRVFASADEELASEGLRGTWAGDRGQLYEILAVQGPGARLRFAGKVAAARIDAAPAGTDVLLAPVDGSAVAIALDLRGPNALDRVPIKCGKGKAGAALSPCQDAGPRERLRRLGARLNLR